MDNIERVHASQLTHGSEEDFADVSAQYQAKIQTESLDMDDPVTPDELKEVRKKLGFSQAHVAMVAGHLLTRESITRIENGRTPCSKTSFIIRAAFAYRLKDFFWKDSLALGPRQKVLVYKGGDHG